ncbi:hypothetical protein CR201_G0029206 [Pongo abelii]|uniref:Uncharacterized protein n=1 Tax=Pongo abelii TaxID=9601 RepID=A0A2J8UAA9_PONAB|nr:hypothetical protein CR201_G0029206 [Pongo abelii]
MPPRAASDLSLRPRLLKPDQVGRRLTWSYIWDMCKFQDCRDLCKQDTARRWLSTRQEKSPHQELILPVP